MTGVHDRRIAIERLPYRLARDASRTIARFFWPGDTQRVRALIDRVIRLEPETATTQLERCVRDFGDRHHDLPGIFEDHYEQASERLGLTDDAAQDRKLLIGAYFTMEYAYASAALFNPSIVPDPWNKSPEPGSTRFVMSLRAVGEGHISSIVFRTGVISADNTITFDFVPTRSRHLKIVEDRSFEREVFLCKLIESGGYSDPALAIVQSLDETFTVRELTRAIEEGRPSARDSAEFKQAAEAMMWLVHSNYEIRAPDGTELSEMVIFPLSENESNGIEDMRLVLFTDDDGRERYFGTYTAYNGSRILPQIMEIPGDRTARVHTLGGKYAVNKGMALFPRRIDGRYAMLLRHDGVNQYFAISDNIRFWNEAVILQEPRYAWEFVQIGNCGSPIETDAGWLVLTHGVGPMRRYCIGAMLLDRDDPSRVIGRLPEPLLMPLAEQRGGYVPNVVYSCGGMIHNDALIIPYGISDVETGFAAVPLDTLLDGLTA